MNYFIFLNNIIEILFHPFKKFNKLSLLKNEIDTSSLLLFSFQSSLIGNISLFFSNAIISNNIYNSFSGILIDLILTLIFSYFYLTIQIAFTYFILTIMNVNINLKELSSYFLLSEFIYLILLPLSFIFYSIPFITSSYYIILFIIMILSLLLKIKSIEILSSFDKIKSTVVLFLPFIILFIMGIISIFYIITKLSTL